MNDDTVEDVAEQTHNQVLMLYGDVFVQLISFDRFNQFMELNYKLELETNHEEGSVRYNVSEKKSNEVVEAMAKIMKETVGDAGPQLVTATGAELTKYAK